MNYFVDEFFCTGPFLELLLDVELPVLFRFSFVFLCVLYILIFVHSFLGGLHLTAISAIFLITKKNSFFFFGLWVFPLYNFMFLFSRDNFFSYLSGNIVLFTCVTYFFFLSTFLTESVLFPLSSLFLYFILVTFLKLGSTMEKLTNLTTLPHAFS